MQNIIALVRNKKIFAQLCGYSALYGFNFKITASTADVMAYYMEEKPQVFIAECRADDLAYLKFLRRLAPSVGILAISQDAGEESAVAAFKNGAGYFLHLPCGSREFHYQLVNFIKLLNLNIGREQLHIIRLGRLKIYLQNNQVMLDNDFIPLTSTEFKLLTLFINNLNRTVSPEELYRLMYETEDLQYTSRVLAMHISKLRRKLKLNEMPDLKLATIHGKGYCLKYSGSNRNGEQR